MWGQEQVLHGRPLSSRVLKDHIKIIEKEFAKNRNVLDFPESNLTQVLSGNQFTGNCFSDLCTFLI